ncbi:uncharacterized protein [Penaeus vannamei]|uniref:uncharacterized protein n=1 Tax=Penaeus vannamei TaxID=6689 RepID=UPI00387F4E12
MMEIDGPPRNNKSKKKRKNRNTNSDSHITWHESEEHLDLTKAETQIQKKQYRKLDDCIKKKKKKEKVKLSDDGYPTSEKVLESTNINKVMYTKKRELSDCEDEEGLIGEEVLELNNEIHKSNKKKKKKKCSDYEQQNILDSLPLNYQKLKATYCVSPKRKKKKKVSISSSKIMEANTCPQHQIMCRADVHIKEKKYSKKKKDSENAEVEIQYCKWDSHEHPQLHVEEDGNIEFTNNHRSTQGSLQSSALETEDDGDDNDFTDDAYEKTVKRKGNKTEKIVTESKKYQEPDLQDKQYVEPDLSEGQHDKLDIPELPEILPLYNVKKYINRERKKTYPMQIRVYGVVRTYEECFYQFPPGVGIPPEEIEEIPDEYNHWKREWKVLSEKKFTEEEIKEEIENKIDKICDYFHRFYTGNLTIKELKPKRPRNFFEVYLPTPDQVEFLKNLHIKVNWKLSLVHRYCYEFIYGTSACRAMAAHGIEWRKSTGLSRVEKEVVLSNWIRFQKEYKFYDLRPLLAVKTLQLVRDGSEIDITNWQYISRRNFINFGLYLCRGLPERTPMQNDGN